MYYDEKPIIGNFENVTYDEETKQLTPYPCSEGQELIVLYNGEFIHCTTITEHDCNYHDKTYLVVVPFNEDNTTDILYEDVKRVAFITYN